MVAERRSRPLVIAHRGASGSFPENTLAAFMAATDAGAQMWEFDVQLSADGVAVVFHDETIDRITGGAGRIADLTLAQLQTLDAGRWKDPRFAGERIPTLDAVVEASAGRAALNIELKAPQAVAQVCRTVRAAGLLDTALVSSFDWNALREARRLEPSVRVAPLADSAPDRLLDAAQAMHAAAINPRFDLVSAELCERAHRAALAIYTWTVDLEELMSLMLDLGVDGIMSNYPERVRAVVDRR